MTESGTPVVFIHGLWLHATSWGPWVELFREAGYEPIAPGWPDEPATVAEAREQPDAGGRTSASTRSATHYAGDHRGLDASRRSSSATPSAA